MPEEYEPVPQFMADYPEVAQTLSHTRLPSYCINCQHKRPTRYITPNFGPFCKECMDELHQALLAGLFGNNLI